MQWSVIIFYVTDHELFLCHVNDHGFCIKIFLRHDLVFINNQYISASIDEILFLRQWTIYCYIVKGRYIVFALKVEILFLRQRSHRLEHGPWRMLARSSCCRCSCRCRSSTRRRCSDDWSRHSSASQFSRWNLLKLC